MRRLPASPAAASRGGPTRRPRANRPLPPRQPGAPPPPGRRAHRTTATKAPSRQRARVVSREPPHSPHASRHVAVNEVREVVWAAERHTVARRDLVGDDAEPLSHHTPHELGGEEP